MERVKKWASVAKDTIVEAIQNFGRDRANRMAAAISYRMVFAAAPLLIIAVSVVSAILESDAEAQARIIETVGELAGPEIADFVAQFLSSALAVGSSAAWVGAILLLWTSSSLFLEVQNDLNDIFGIPYDWVSGFVPFVKQRGIGFLWALALGLIIVAVALLDTVWGFMKDLLPDELGGLHAVIDALTPLISLAVLPFLFGLVFQTMTAVKVRWRAALWGGFFTAVVVIIAAHGMSLYFRVFGEPTAIGLASSFVVVLFVTYMLASVFLIGAEVTKIYSDHLGGLKADLPDEVPAETPTVLVTEPPDLFPRGAVFAFLSGLFVGWRRSRR